MHSRRLFLKNSALAMFGIGAAPGWLARAVYAQDGAPQRKRILIVIFQRGAVDGLNVVVPHAEPSYYAMRPTIAIARPGADDASAIDLDGRFGLHPSLRDLKPLWDRGEFAIIEAVGSPDPTRSHFDAQDYMESGTPGVRTTPDGWLNRAMPREPHPSPARAVSLTPDLPRMLRGKNDALAVASIGDFRVRDPRAAAEFERVYGESEDRILNGTARETFEAVKLMQSFEGSAYTPANGANYPEGRLGRSLQQIARMIKADVGLEVAFTDIGGWDTHVNEAGQLANLLRDFGAALAAFSQDMGDQMADITLVTMSEFGRTVKENGNRGTDHGHANVMFALGGRIRGGKVYGQWPGLGREHLYEERDLNVTTDFRTVLAEIVSTQLGNRQIGAVFPSFTPTKFLGIV